MSSSNCAAKSPLTGARVLVTGGSGFLGRHLTRVLKEYDAQVFPVGKYRGTDGGSYDYSGVDLTNPYALPAFLDLFGPFDYVFHAAGWNGGLFFNQNYPADIFHQNTLMGLNLLEACARKGVGKVVSVVASCAYPTDIQLLGWNNAKARNSPSLVFGGLTTYPGICQENVFLDGRPDPSVACHGYAKRNLQLASQFYRQQYKLDAVCVCPTTLYGPGDSFEPERTKVMGGMVKRFVDATEQGLKSVEVWGSGNPLREFLYVQDAAYLIAWSAEMYDSSLPLNLGSGQEVSIRKLAEMVADAAGYQGQIRFDTSRPDGAFRKRLDLTRMYALLGPESRTVARSIFTPLEVGITETVKAYRRQKNEAGNCPA